MRLVSRLNDIVLAILAKDKAYCLDLYLKCLLNQTFPKSRIRLWVRTNDNKDETKEILDKFIRDHGYKYKSIYYDYSNIDSSLKGYEEHEWNSTRFGLLGRIRQESIEYTKEHNAHYVVVDCDNFLAPHVLQSMYDDRHLGLIGPMLRLAEDRGYANFHHKSCPLGYMDTDDPIYWQILKKEITGKIKVATLHCTYLIRNSLLDYARYVDETEDWEYIVFSNSLKKYNIPQYMDNSTFQGLLYLNTADCGRSYDQWFEEIWTEAVKQLMQV